MAGLEVSAKNIRCTMFHCCPPLNTSKEIKKNFPHFVQQQQGQRYFTALGLLPGENYLIPETPRHAGF